MLDEKLLVWIVDDNEPNSFYLNCLTRRAGYSTAIFNTGSEVVSAYIKTPSDKRPKAILMDIQMPHKDGYQTTKEIREYEQKNNLPRVNIIAVTANHNSEFLQNKITESGIDNCVFKPVVGTQKDVLFQYMTKQNDQMYATK